MQTIKQMKNSLTVEVLVVSELMWQKRVMQTRVYRMIFVFFFESNKQLNCEILRQKQFFYSSFFLFLFLCSHCQNIFNSLN